MIPKPDWISSDIAQSPNGLLVEPTLILLQQSKQRIHGVLVDERLALRSGSSCDIGENPAGFKPHLRVLFGMNKHDEWGQYSAIDNNLHSPLVLVLWDYLPQRYDSLMLNNWIWMDDIIDGSRQLLLRILLL